MIAVLAACDTPSRAFWGAEPTRLTVGSSSFDVRQNGTQAEAIRLNPTLRPNYAVISREAEAAIEQVTGCAVDRLGGDVAVVRATLICTPGVDASWPAQYDPGRSSALSCVADALGGGTFSLYCD
ncbi:hypothetical protein N6L24_13275 [Cognatishimia sp. SS12]|uniref:hypothetical protein n=1 Tax=Cognatishimia sp. SS12 TaxID=2979465 RepID=UPI00232BB984|nr:hypothetical protein [Cognatishimia sp. SS12]MDC0739253.1 hypothetical protein [Cognatishimia sp. SS12]